MNTCGEEKQVQAGGDLRGGQTPTNNRYSGVICLSPVSTGPSTPVLPSSGFGFTLARPYGSRGRARWRLSPPPNVHHEHHCDRSLLPRVLKRPYPAGGKPAAGTTVSLAWGVVKEGQSREVTGRRKGPRRNGPKKGAEERSKTRRDGPKKQAAGLARHD